MSSGPGEMDDGVLLQLARPPQHCPPQHYAFHLDEEHFDRALERLRVDGRDHWADPRRDRPGEINREHGGRGVYLLDPDGHLVECSLARICDPRPAAGHSGVRIQARLARTGDDGVRHQ